MPEVGPSRYLINAGWSDVPHLSEEAKRELLESTPPYLRDARSKGIPSLGSGAIYPIPESSIACDFFPIPKYWPRAYAMDVGWKRTAAIWGAWDPETGQCFLYAEHYRAEGVPSIHADAIKARGTWIHGVGDAAAVSQQNGEQMLEIYRGLQLHLTLADKSVDAGIYDVWTALETGQLKVMRNLLNWFAEYRLYRRDEKGKIVKANDHLMDCTRYLIRSGRNVSRVKPAPITFGGGSAGDDRMAY